MAMTDTSILGHHSYVIVVMVAVVAVLIAVLAVSHSCE